MARMDVVVVGSYVQDQAWFVDRFPRIGETLKAHRYNTGPGAPLCNEKYRIIVTSHQKQIN